MFWPGVALMVFLVGVVYAGWIVDFDDMEREVHERDDPDW